jgi:superfamily I DNA/RNA helicase
VSRKKRLSRRGLIRKGNKVKTHTLSVPVPRPPLTFSSARVPYEVMPDIKSAEKDFERELQAAIDLIVRSNHPKKIVVAGPGAGKTSLFKKLLSKSKAANRDANHLVVTFINALAEELKHDLSELADVFTFHAHCKQLLHRNPYLREGLTEGFRVFPKLPSLIKSDWSLLHAGDQVPPHFVKLMREAIDNDATGFFLDRSNYYDAVSFDDMVFRVYLKLAATPHAAERHDLILVDEYQDFNFLEISLLEILSRKSAIVVAGDDDQVLYGPLRSSHWNFIRKCHASPDYEACELPFCLRCPEVVVNAFDDVVRAATAAGLLKGRIPKAYRYFPPYKGRDSAAHPKLHIIQTSIQRSGTGNYFGRLIAEIVRSMPSPYIKDSRDGGYPTVLIIGNKQYLSQISAHLKDQGYVLDEKESGKGEEDQITREDGLKILKEDAGSSLGWRIMLEMDKPTFFMKTASRMLSTKPLVPVIPKAYRDRVSAEVRKFEEPPAKAKQPQPEFGKPTIKLTSFQSAKGLSAQFVFVVGLHDRDLPKNANKVDDIEVCKFLVALTRTRKQCFLLWTGRFAGVRKKPSVFLNWIDRSRKNYTYVDAKYLYFHERETQRRLHSS